MLQLLIRLRCAELSGPRGQAHPAEASSDLVPSTPSTVLGAFVRRSHCLWMVLWSAKYKYCLVLSFYRERWWRPEETGSKSQGKYSWVLFSVPRPSSIRYSGLSCKAEVPNVGLVIRALDKRFSNFNGQMNHLCKMQILTQSGAEKLPSKLQVTLGLLVCGPHFESESHD